MSVFRQSLVGASTALGIGAIDVNWTELQEVFAEIMDLLVAILQELPEVVVYVAVVVLILIVVGFITGLFDKILGMIKFR